MGPLSNRSNAFTPNDGLRILKCAGDDLGCKTKLVLGALFNPLAFVLVSTGEAVGEVVDNVRNSVEEAANEFRNDLEEGLKTLLLYLVLGLAAIVAWKVIQRQYFN